MTATICEIDTVMIKPHGSILAFCNNVGSSITLGETKLKTCSTYEKFDVDITYIEINDYHFIEEKNYLELCVNIVNQNDYDDFFKNAIEGEKFNIVFIIAGGKKVQVSGVYFFDFIDFRSECAFLIDN